MDTVLVTGGAGYIGAHACKALAGAGYRPVAFDNLSFGHVEAVQWGPLVRGDLADRGALDSAIREHRPAAIMHFAAFAFVGESISDPGKYYRNNVLGTLNLLEAMRDHAVATLVFSSSCATYGIPDRLPIAETCPQMPINPYGQTKLASERMITDFASAQSLNAVALRYFNACGADPEGEIGEDHDPETHLIPLALDAAAGRGELTVFGDDYDTPDGTCIRDYIHVSDLADAHVRALKALEQGGCARALNLGTGQGISNRQVLEAIERVTGKPVPHRIGPRRSGDPARLVADASLAHKELAFTARYSDIDTIIETAWRWHQRTSDG